MAAVPLHRVVATRQQRQPHQLRAPLNLAAALVQEKVQYHQLIQVTKLAWPHYGGNVMPLSGWAHKPSKKKSPGSLINTAFALPGKGHAILAEVATYMNELCVQNATPYTVTSAGV